MGVGVVPHPDNRLEDPQGGVDVPSVDGGKKDRAWEGLHA